MIISGVVCNFVGPGDGRVRWVFICIYYWGVMCVMGKAREAVGVVVFLGLWSGGLGWLWWVFFLGFDWRWLRVEFWW